ncbi:MAG: rRNA maturation RNase YbeY [Lachnospiraceae bacterium]|nr:rRNA maturation RNase YbeY [Lachnospiraceae bacterium]
MTAVIEKETDISFDFDYEALFPKIVAAVTEAEACPYEVSVSLFLTGNEEIKELNRMNRGIDSVTDVLSFPLAVYPAPSDFSELEKDPDNFDPDTGELLLGDIVLSADQVLLQAESYGHSPKREYAFLIVHSLLHLFGYDHIEDRDRKLMEGRQEEIMRILAIPRFTDDR